uniref:DUF6699 domain-containing protein n=1 Tax=Moniliophthora roreri TaxID=221103 RepID=A0A0W0FBG6_MONRR
MHISLDDLKSSKWRRVPLLPSGRALYPNQHLSLPETLSITSSLILSPCRTPPNAALIIRSHVPAPGQPSSLPNSPEPPARLRERRCIPLPSQLLIPVEIRLHHRLRIHTYIFHDFSSTYLSDPATEPSLPSMTLIHPDLPHPVDIITVHCSMVNPNYVTVYDVLTAIGQALDQGRGLEYLGRDGAKSFAGLRKSTFGGDIWEMEFR